MGSWQLAAHCSGGGGHQGCLEENAPTPPPPARAWVPPCPGEAGMGLAHACRISVSREPVLQAPRVRHWGPQHRQTGSRQGGWGADNNSAVHVPDGEEPRSTGPGAGERRLAFQNLCPDSQSHSSLLTSSEKASLLLLKASPPASPSTPSSFQIFIPYFTMYACPPYLNRCSGGPCFHSSPQAGRPSMQAACSELVPLPEGRATRALCWGTDSSHPPSSRASFPFLLSRAEAHSRFTWSPLPLTFVPP